jgi:penicillin-binding protein 1C
VIALFGMMAMTRFKIAIQWWDTKKTQWYTTFAIIPNRIVDAMIAVEDKRFWRHSGVDLVATIRAWYQTIIKKNIQWWSTIDQQLIKLTDAQFTRSITRKLYEYRYAINLQFHYSKKEIITAYINTIPFSHGIQWRNAACNIYFHKWCEYLSDSELVYIFALWQLWINPYKESNQATIISRAKTLCRLLEKKWITTQSWCDILSAENPVSIYSFQTQLDPKISLFLEQQSPELQKLFSSDTYDNIENILHATQTHRVQYDAQYCCVTVLDKNGGVISMNTCSDRTDEKAGKINACTEPRQVWSAIKPFLYLYAFQQKWLKSTDTIVDEPVNFDLWDGSIYSPKNFDLSYHGEVTYAYALWNSLNVPAIKTLHSLWVDPFLQFLKKQLASYASWYDQNTKDANNVWLSLALWTYEMSPYAFGQLWRMFLPWNMIAWYEKNTQAIVDILSDPKNKVASFWQDTFLNIPWRAVKTWTSRKFIDWRVCGAHQEKWITLCVWMWNINNQAMKWPSSEVGSYIWSVIAKGL